MIPSKGCATPWGAAQTVEVVAPGGIYNVSTAGHGGYYVTTEWLKKMPKFLREGNWNGHRNWFEEDCDWCKVILAFPESFDPSHYKIALDFAEKYKPALHRQIVRTPHAAV